MNGQTRDEEHADHWSVLSAEAVRLADEPHAGAVREVTALAQRLSMRLRRPARIMLLGEINSGKSSLANLLIGKALAPTCVVPNTRFTIRFHYAAPTTLTAVLRDGSRMAVNPTRIEDLASLPLMRLDVGLPLDRLRTLEIVDTPGSGDPQRVAPDAEDQRTQAHISLWCTVAGRAWKESERRVWMRLPRSLKLHSILVVTQVDLLPKAEYVERVVDRLRRETEGIFQAVVPVALPDAFASNVVGSEGDLQGLWERSGGACLERVLTYTLVELKEERVARAKAALRRAFSRDQPQISLAVPEIGQSDLGSDMLVGSCTPPALAIRSDVPNTPSHREEGVATNHPEPPPTSSGPDNAG